MHPDKPNLFVCASHVINLNYVISVEFDAKNKGIYIIMLENNEAYLKDDNALLFVEFCKKFS